MGFALKGVEAGSAVYDGQLELRGRLGGNEACGHGLKQALHFFLAAGGEEMGHGRQVACKEASLGVGAEQQGERSGGAEGLGGNARAEHAGGRQAKGCGLERRGVGSKR